MCIYNARSEGTPEIDPVSPDPQSSLLHFCTSKPSGGPRLFGNSQTIVHREREKIWKTVNRGPRASVFQIFSTTSG